MNEVKGLFCFCCKWVCSTKLCAFKNEFVFSMSEHRTTKIKIPDLVFLLFLSNLTIRHLKRTNFQSTLLKKYVFFVCLLFFVVLRWMLMNVMMKMIKEKREEDEIIFKKNYVESSLLHSEDYQFTTVRYLLKISND